MIESNKKEILNLHKSIPSFKLGTPIQIAGNNYKLILEDKKYYIQTTLFSGQEINRFKLQLKVKDKTQRNIIYNILHNIYKQGSAQIKKEKNKIFLILSYSFENKEEINLDKEKIMGIDLGLTNVAVMAFNFSKKRFYIKGGEIKEHNNRIKARRKSIQQQGKYCGDARNGHGRKRKLKPIESLKKKESNYRDYINHRYSKYIVKIAYENNCGIIKMEDLEGINKDKTFLKEWPYFDLQEKIIYKAKGLGINVVKVKPDYTSQMCSKCGYIDKENRETQSEFICKECGFSINADYNAALNISRSEKIVKEC